jgi:hypothetical protein
MTVIRDDFSEALKKTLAQSVWLRCSNPRREAETGGPPEDPAKSVNAGIAAHVTSPAPGWSSF